MGDLSGVRLRNSLFRARGVADDQAMILLQILKDLFHARHDIELVRPECVVSAANHVICSCCGNKLISYFCFASFCISKHDWISKASSIGFASATWPIVLNVSVVALVSKNAFHPYKKVASFCG